MNADYLCNRPCHSNGGTRHCMCVAADTVRRAQDARVSLPSYHPYTWEVAAQVQKWRDEWVQICEAKFQVMWPYHDIR